MSNVIIIGAGPAGLAAGYTLEKQGVNCTLLDKDTMVGGISKTVEFKGYKFDLGGHRFFTKSDTVQDVWNDVLGYNFKKTARLSRIYYNNKFFNYPLTPINAFCGMGPLETMLILLSYLMAKVMPLKVENTFEQWVTNRFGKKLYEMFFKTYTEKVWGTPCNEISAEWAAQRIKGLSLKEAIMNAFRGNNKNIKTLIDEFEYPVMGPGMMYDEMNKKIISMGGTSIQGARVVKVYHNKKKIKGVEYEDSNGLRHTATGADFISSMPITDLICAMEPVVSDSIARAAASLRYRSFLTVNVIICRKDLFPDNWLYIHSPDVKLGRIQNFKNWSPQMVPDENMSSLGLEYFCEENGPFWSMSDENILELASGELEKLNICRANEIVESIIVRVPKAYPVYDVGYKRHLEIIKDYLHEFDNLQLIGRYGLFKYNNMDHSMLTGIYAAENILSCADINDTWEVNTEEDYHEELKSEYDKGCVGNSAIKVTA